MNKLNTTSTERNTVNPANLNLNTGTATGNRNVPGLTEHGMEEVNARRANLKRWIEVLTQYNGLYLFIDTAIGKKEKALTEKARENGTIKANEKIAVSTGYTIELARTGLIKFLIDKFGVYNKSKNVFEFPQTEIPLFYGITRDIEYLNIVDAQLYVFYYLMYKQYTKSHCEIHWYDKSINDEAVPLDLGGISAYANATLYLKITPTKKYVKVIKTAMEKLCNPHISDVEKEDIMNDVFPDIENFFNGFSK